MLLSEDGHFNITVISYSNILQCFCTVKDFKFIATFRKHLLYLVLLVLYMFTYIHFIYFIEMYVLQL